MLDFRHSVSEEKLRAVPEPEFTDTWHPLSHAKVIDVIESVVSEYDLKVARKRYAAAQDGQVMFGVWTIEGEQVRMIHGERLHPAIMFRNSVN